MRPRGHEGRPRKDATKGGREGRRSRREPPAGRGAPPIQETQNSPSSYHYTEPIRTSCLMKIETESSDASTWPSGWFSLDGGHSKTNARVKRSASKGIHNEMKSATLASMSISLDSSWGLVNIENAQSMFLFPMFPGQGAANIQQLSQSDSNNHILPPLHYMSQLPITCKSSLTNTFPNKPMSPAAHQGCARKQNIFEDVFREAGPIQSMLRAFAIATRLDPCATFPSSM